jgi:hypothetical protein
MKILETAGSPLELLQPNNNSDIIAATSNGVGKVKS